MQGAIKMIKDQGLGKNMESLLCTVGGACKFDKMFQKELNVSVDHRDEISCLLTGLNFMLEHVEDECYYLEDLERPLQSVKKSHPMSDIYPYLLVNVGSGVSTMRVDSPQSFERIGGSPIGGGTFWGLRRRRNTPTGTCGGTRTDDRPHQPARGAGPF